MKNKVTKAKALKYHEFPRPGKIEVLPTKPYSSQYDLSLAYSPGVAYPCEEIAEDAVNAYKYTDKGNLIAVISNGTAVLGLGDIGADAAKPVMEGKALLFKIFSGLDAFDIEVNEKDPDKFVEIVKALEPTFGGINLEDIKAPECFEIEEKLKAKCNIPVMHDDQHGTAIISAAALLNAAYLQKKELKDIKMVVNGAGAAAISCTRLYVKLGIDPENIVMCDSKGVIRKDRTDLNSRKREFATDRDIHTLAEAMIGADLFLGLSVADVLTEEMVLSMAKNPIIFALANPNPEINYELAVKTRPDLIIATGRSDYPNQINNVLGFPYIFRGALDCQATAINEDMKVAAVYAIANLAKEPVPSTIDEAYDINSISFGKDYIIPKALDPRLLVEVAPAVAQAAMKSGIARKPIANIKAYKTHLESLMGDNGKLMRGITEIIKRQPKRIVFDHGEEENVIKAASRLVQENACIPVLLGDSKTIEKKAVRLGVDLHDIIILNPKSEVCKERREAYASLLYDMKQREGVTAYDAKNLLWTNEYFAMMMLESGDADGCVASMQSAAGKTIDRAREIIGISEGYENFATMHIMNSRKGTFYLCDTAINSSIEKRTLEDIIRLADKAVKLFGDTPVMSLLSYSNFGSNSNERIPRMSAEVIDCIHKNYPEIKIDGEMQANFALDTELRDKMFPFNTIKGEKVNTFIFPDINSANITYKMLCGLGVAEIIGPIQIGLKKSIHFLSPNSKTKEIVDIAKIAALYATINFEA